MKNNLGLYIHVPFCAAKCSYCDFYSLAGELSHMDAYVSHLCMQLEQAAARCCDNIVDTVYFGGGTPSLLGGARLAHIMRTIQNHFALTEDAEITAEANPDSMSDDFLQTARSAGINRLSMGIQSACDDELRALGRIHTFAEACDAFHRARQAGFSNLSVDLMYALPGQTMEQLGASIDALLALEPEHLSCYGLTVEPHTPLGRSHPVLPPDDVQADMYLMLCDRMNQAGFSHYEISNFAREPRFRSRHNSRYWKQSPYLGFGPGAHGDFDGIRYEWPRDLAAWLSDTAAPVQEDDDIDRALEYIMLSLRTGDGWDADVYQKTFGRNPKPVIQVFESLPKVYSIRTGNRWHLTDSGFLVSNSIILAAIEAADTN